MNETTKSLIRHLLTALGTVALVLGLGKYTGVINYLLENLDSVTAAITALVGFVTTLIGFFKPARPATTTTTTTATK